MIHFRLPERLSKRGFGVVGGSAKVGEEPDSGTDRQRQFAGTDRARRSEDGVVVEHVVFIDRRRPVRATVENWRRDR